MKIDLEYIKNNNELKDNQIDDVYKDLGLLCEENNLEEKEYLDDIFKNLINEEIICFDVITITLRDKNHNNIN